MLIKRLPAKGHQSRRHDAARDHGMDRMPGVPERTHRVGVSLRPWPLPVGLTAVVEWYSASRRQQSAATNLRLYRGLKVVKASKPDASERKRMNLNAYATSGTSPTQSDFVCENHFSIFLLRPTSPAASDWIEAHLPADRMTFGDAVVVELR